MWEERGVFSDKPVGTYIDKQALRGYTSVETDMHHVL